MKSRFTAALLTAPFLLSMRQTLPAQTASGAPVTSQNQDAQSAQFTLSDDILDAPLPLEEPAVSDAQLNESDAPQIEPVENDAVAIEESEYVIQQEGISSDNTDEDSSKFAAAKGGKSEVPAAKRPLKPTKEQTEALSSIVRDNDEASQTLKYGLESDITELLDSLIKDKDCRFAEDVYDLFHDAKTSAIREKVLSYFTELKDPCLEDYAVALLNDPYDEKLSTVNAVFKYVEAVKTTVAAPAVVSLIESDNQEYFSGAVTALAAIGGAQEAVFLAEYLEREDLTVNQRQSLVKVLGQMKAVETYDKLVSLATDPDENSFIRMYSAQSIGEMQKEEAIEILLDLYEDSEPNLRVYVVKGLSNFKGNAQAESLIIQAVRDSHYKVRLEAIDVIKNNEIKSAVPYLVYRAKNDPETVVKDACYPAIAALNTSEGNEYLIEQLTDKKVSDTAKSKVARALLTYKNAQNEIIALAEETLTDDKRKPLRYALGKEFAKNPSPEFEDICIKYLTSKDVSTIGTGLDIYASGRYAKATEQVRSIASAQDDAAKKTDTNAAKAKRILGETSAAAK